MIFITKSVHTAAFISGILLFSSVAAASDIDTLFLSGSVIKMELVTDFSAIQAERTGTPVYHEGTLTYRSKGNKPVTLPVKVMARGNFRLNPANCGFPPLMIDFETEKASNTLFENQDKLKLVTPCQGEEEVIREYAAYRMYNLVTDKSFNVRLARISFIDEATNKKLFEKHSFFLEDKDHLAARNNAWVAANGVSSADISRENYRNLGIFQYMIGNLDWNVTMGKNIVVIQDKDHPSELYAVPYDFDFSALVNAQYSKIKGVEKDIRTERRRYVGACYREDELSEGFNLFRELKPELEKVIKDQKTLEWEDREEMLDFLNLFFRLTDDPVVVTQEFSRECM